MTGVNASTPSCRTIIRLNEQQHEPDFTGRIRSFMCAFGGICVMISSQHNAWIHSAATVIVVIVASVTREIAARDAASISCSAWQPWPG